MMNLRDKGKSMTSKKAQRLMSLSFLCIFVFLFCFNAKLTKNERKRVDSAVEVLTELMETPDKGIPTDVLDKCQCVAVIPSVKKGAFIFGGQYGKGLVSCRRPEGGWSAPVFFSLSGGSIGFQIGGQSIDLVLMIMNKRGIDHLLQDKFTIGGDASVAAGPVGRTAKAETDAQLNAEILAYSRTQGVFAGISLSGSVFKPDKDANKDLYGRSIAAKDILVDGKVEYPRETELFITTLTKLSATKS
jgi:SH3 domain-containing YSC84-like protein 1